MEEIIARLLADYRQNRQIDVTVGLCRPDPAAVGTLIDRLRILMFPGYFREELCCAGLESYISMVTAEVMLRLEGQLLPLLEGDEVLCRQLCRDFLLTLPRLRQDMQLDLQAFLEGDPAAVGEQEIIISYPGFYAIMVYRMAHMLHEMGVPVLPRMMTEHAHSHTGIDIHPGAKIGQSFFIDHGTGIVIGETAVIGRGVKLYQGVTLGAMSTRGGRNLQKKKRHPTIEDAVTIYAGASILGGDTVIGAGAVIGGNAFVIASVEPGATVIGRRPGP